MDSVFQPSILRITIWPDASKAQNSIAAVSADGSTVCVLIRRLNSSCRRSMDDFGGPALIGEMMAAEEEQIRADLKAAEQSFRKHPGAQGLTTEWAFCRRPACRDAGARVPVGGPGHCRPLHFVRPVFFLDFDESLQFAQGWALHKACSTPGIV